MKKYFIFILSFLVISFLHFAFSPSVVQAVTVGEGQTCIVVARNAPPMQCADGLRCDAQSRKCVKDTREVLECTCQNQGKTGSGQNGFTCGNGPVIYCNGSSSACFEQDGAPLDKASTKGGAQSYPDKNLAGVRCDAQEQATCTCDNPGTPGSGKNGMTCKIQGQPDGTGFCDQAGDACVAGGQMDEDGTEQLGEDAGGIYDNRTLVGVHCGQPEATCKCKNPGVSGSGENGMTCTLPGQAPKDGFCDDQSAACISGGKMDEDGTEGFGGSPYDNTTFIGVMCGDAPEATHVPPPSPPCTEGKWTAEGKCQSLITALGELETDPSGFIKRLFAVLLSFSGGIALLLIMKAGYQMMTSQGKPEQLQAGRDQLIAAIVGLVFLIFSLVLLQVIGYDILRVPEFGQ